eukprot:gene7332-5166_t
MSYAKPIGDSKLLDKKPPARNEKFAKVKPVVESGMTVELAEYMRQNAIKVKKQPGELFKRVLTKVVADDIERKINPEILPDGGFAKPMDEYRGGRGAQPQEVELLLVDCRPEEDYKQCHIAGALHYPRVKVIHATNPFLPEMFSFKNKENKLIVMYDLEEEMAVELANIVFQKGIDNIAIMAGGLREFVQDYSAYLIGTCPVPIVPRDERLKRRADEVTLARSEARSSASHKPKSLSNSLARPHYRK